MPNECDPGDASAFRALPSVEELAARAQGLLGPSARACGRAALLAHVRAVLEAWRADIRDEAQGRDGAKGKRSASDVAQRLARGGLERDVAARVEREARAGVRRAINATGVVLHTGLGRAPVHAEAARAMADVAAHYCVLELDREDGERNERDARVSQLLARLCGAEAAIAVNNNAAATYLVLSTFAWGGREVVVSRGELVEIGGSFRMPDVMARAGVALKEVGTTNRTRLSDYRAAAGPRTGLLLKVHTSNYRVEGFTAEVAPAELAALGRELALPSAYDLGSGRLEVDGAARLDVLGDEPGVVDAVASGVDVVTFSGDKLLGGPQAGLIVGRRAAVAELRRNPIYRALRLDKVTLAGMERTLELYAQGRADELPARARLLAHADDLRAPAEELARALGELPALTCRAEAAQSQPGSGSAPGVFLPTWAVRVEHAELAPSALAARLRRGEPPLFARVQDGALWLDLRTLLDGDVPGVLDAFRALSARPHGPS